MIRGNEIHIRKGNWREKDFMRRVSLMLHGDGSGASGDHPLPFLKGSGYKWALDYSNDWWGDIDETSRHFVVVWRYGGCDSHREILEAFEKTIVFLLHIDHRQGVKIKNQKFLCNCGWNGPASDLLISSYNSYGYASCVECGHFMFWDSELSDLGIDISTMNGIEIH